MARPHVHLRVLPKCPSISPISCWGCAAEGGCTLSQGQPRTGQEDVSPGIAAFQVDVVLEVIVGHGETRSVRRCVRAAYR